MQDVKVLFTYVNGTVSRRKLVIPVPARTWAIPNIKLEGDWGAVPTEPQVMRGIEQVEGLLTNVPEVMDDQSMKEACKLARRAGIAEALRDIKNGDFADEKSLKQRFLMRMDVHYFFNELRRFQTACPEGNTSVVYQDHNSSRCLADPRLPHFIAGYQRAVMYRLQQLA